MEVIVLFPLVLTLIFGIVQGAMWFHARDAARSAASQAVEAARLEGGTDAVAHQSAGQLLGQIDALSSYHVDVTRTAQTVSVTVRGSSQMIIDFPGWDLTVDQTATSALEGWTP
ncbi:MAG TPA: TadE/TadG family type IV pilus assembly protein [Jiangellaceae bacterium]|nr:TadE/TadG family type IV pilus assembly protein [Jiangellaceae bacterium]